VNIVKRCPECGGELVNEALEWKCPKCGYTECIEPEYCPPEHGESGELR
jgi:DNA-directed RNA polymerase subunit M/transcription elongation factor TFIIS